MFSSETIDINSPLTNYYYQVRLVKVVDGDTLKLNIDLGLDTWIHKKNVRLFGINAPEVRGIERPAGLKAKIHMEALITHDSVTGLYIQTFKDRTGKYGRYLANILVQTSSNTFHNINQQMILDGFAKEADY